MIAQGVMKYKEWNKTSEVGVMGAALLGVKTVCLDTDFRFYNIHLTLFLTAYASVIIFTTGRDQIDATIF